MRVERARYYLAAVETGSLRAAATRCGVSQPTLGQQVTLLEEELDVVLLTRSRTGVRPTPAGQALIEPMRRMVAAEDAVRATATDSGAPYRGRVAIGAISVVAETVIAPVVGWLREHHPDLRFTVTESSSTAIEAAVLDGNLDFGVITMPAGDPAPGLLRSELLAAPIGAVVPSDHLLADRSEVVWRDLETWPIVTMGPGTVLWDQLRDRLPEAQVVVEAEAARSLRAMVAEGAGVGVLAPFEIALDVPGLRWIPLRDAEPLRTGIVGRRNALPSPSALLVRRLIQQRAAELLAAAGAADSGDLT